jgi:hypothetical protein
LEALSLEEAGDQLTCNDFRNVLPKLENIRLAARSMCQRLAGCACDYVIEYGKTTCESMCKPTEKAGDSSTMTAIIAVLATVAVAAVAAVVWLCCRLHRRQRGSRQRPSAPPDDLELGSTGFQSTSFTNPFASQQLHDSSGSSELLFEAAETGKEQQQQSGGFRALFNRTITIK